MGDGLLCDIDWDAVICEDSIHGVRKQAVVHWKGDLAVTLKEFCLRYQSAAACKGVATVHVGVQHLLDALVHIACLKEGVIVCPAIVCRPSTEH
eukprot:1101999-Amphidinium_carterae.1